MFKFPNIKPCSMEIHTIKLSHELVLWARPSPHPIHWGFGSLLTLSSVDAVLPYDFNNHLDNSRTSRSLRPMIFLPMILLFTSSQPPAATTILHSIVTNSAIILTLSIPFCKLCLVAFQSTFSGTGTTVRWLWHPEDCRLPLTLLQP